MKLEAARMSCSRMLRSVEGLGQPCLHADQISLIVLPAGTSARATPLGIELRGMRVLPRSDLISPSWFPGHASHFGKHCVACVEADFLRPEIKEVALCTLLWKW